MSQVMCWACTPPVPMGEPEQITMHGVVDPHTVETLTVRRCPQGHMRTLHITVHQVRQSA